MNADERRSGIEPNRRSSALICGQILVFPVDAMLSSMSRSESDGSLKGKHGLVLSARLHPFFEHAPIAEIDAGPENIGQPDLQPSQIEQR